MATWVQGQPLEAERVDTAYRLLVELPVEVDWFTTDGLGQVYVVDLDGDVLKYDANGVFLFRYSNYMLGRLGWMDAMNPMGVLLYYPDYATVVWLDRTLNEIGRHSLFDWQLWEVWAVGAAKDNMLWVYDGEAATLKKLDKQARVVVEGDNVGLALGHALRPAFILERGDRLYVYDESRGVYIFDNYGHYRHAVGLTGVEGVQVLGKELAYVQDGVFRTWNMDSIANKSLPLPYEPSAGVLATHARVCKDVFWVQLGHKLRGYAYGF